MAANSQHTAEGSGEGQVLWFGGNGTVTISSKTFKTVLRSRSDLKRKVWIPAGSSLKSTGTAYIHYYLAGDCVTYPPPKIKPLIRTALADSFVGKRPQAEPSNRSSAVEFVGPKSDISRLFVFPNDRLRFFWATEHSRRLIRLVADGPTSLTPFIDESPEVTNLSKSPLASYSSKGLDEYLASLQSAKEDVSVILTLSFADGKQITLTFLIASKSSLGAVNAYYRKWKAVSETDSSSFIALNQLVIALEKAGCQLNATDLVCRAWEEAKETAVARSWMATIADQSDSSILARWFKE
jgi:hypothetical protein